MSLDQPIPFMIGVGLGGLAAVTAMPAPMPKKDCETYTVANKLVTAYVLKPPHVEPEIIHEKCPAPKVVEAPRVEEPQVEDKPRRHRRHRWRRHWR